MTTALQGAQPTRARPTTKNHPLRSVLPFTLAALLSASCVVEHLPVPDSSAGTGGSGADLAGPPADSGSVTVTTANVASPGSVDGKAPAADRYFLTLDVTLADVSAPEAVPASFRDYTLATAGGLILAPDPVSARIAVPCPSDLWVSAEARYTCTLVFQVPSGDTPARLAYDDQQGDTATAPVAAAPPPIVVSAACTTFLKEANAESDACVQCTTSACQFPFNAVLDDGETCPSALEPLLACGTDPGAAGYCACAAAVLGACEPAFDAMYQCRLTACASACG